MPRDNEKRATTKTLGLLTAYLLGIGSGLLALAAASGNRGLAAVALVALIAAMVVALVPRVAGRRREERPPAAVAWTAASAIGQDLPTVSDYYQNAPDGMPPTAPSQSPYRRWEPLPPETPIAEPVASSAALG